MTEFYNLPILYTKEEAQRYAEWGIKKSRLLWPFAIIVIGIDFLVILSTVLYCISLVLGREIFPQLFGFFVSKISYAISTSLTFIIICPLNAFFDLIYHKPPEPLTLRLQPSPNGMLYTLLRKKKELSAGVLSWTDWPNIIFPETNEIIIEGKKLKIAKNTIESIYPKEKQKPWMDYPSEKITGTIRLEQIQQNMTGYFASLESQKKEAEWEKQHLH